MNTPDPRIEAKQISDENAAQRMKNNAVFSEELTALLNRHSQENASGTPDFILSVYIRNCLAAFNGAVNQREQWYGRAQDPRFGTPPHSLGTSE